MRALLNQTDVTSAESTSLLESRALSGVVVALALATCLFIVALPMLGSLAVAATILALFTGLGLAAIVALSHV